MDQSFSPAARSHMREAISGAAENEVFFLGRTDAQRRVVEVEVLARGSSKAVPAILQVCDYGDVVIHNHPSGELHPSEADLAVASSLGSLGVGFYIVDNHVGNVYRVVEPFAPAEEKEIHPQRLTDILGPKGNVAQSLPGYEDRPEQLRMAFAVGEAFNRSRLSIIEAGTGTGKSLAYLVPAILWALENGERVVISTNTINLQEQLIRKDLPFLERSAGLAFRAVLVKGRTNYLCRRRLDSATAEPDLFDTEKTGEFQAIIEWSNQTEDGSREELSFLPSEQVWEEVRCEIDQCGRVRCSHFQECFFHRARRRASQAHLLVVNHALLLSDLALRRMTDNYSATAVLPPFDRIILDEAHHLEDVATSYFSSQVTRFTFSRVLNKLRHPRKPDKGLLPRLLSGLARELPDSQDDLYRELHGRIESILAARQDLLEKSQKILEEIGIDLAAALAREIVEREEIRFRIVPAFVESDTWETISAQVKNLSRQAGLLSEEIQQFLKACGRVPDESFEKLASPLTDLRGIGLRLEGIAADLAGFIAGDEQTCAWIEVIRGRIGRGHGIVTRLCTAPLEVAGGLKEALYERFKTVVMTSATLTVSGRFDYFRRRVGLDHAETHRIQELLLASPFDFSTQALVAVPTDIPEPGRTGYPESIRDLTERSLLAADGRTFVLFTAYSLLRRVFAEIAPIMTARGYQCLRQGEKNRHLLLKQFAADPTSILFATDSFWEGVDVPGAALEQVIIARLPFKVPTEPIREARAEAITLAGGDPFLEFTVPQAVIKFRQGFGRLIRHREDRGVVLLLDSRAVKKGYGRIFLRSLPEVRVFAAPAEDVIKEIEHFFSECRHPSDKRRQN